MSDTWRKLIEAGKPRTSFWRFFISAGIIAVITAVCAMLVSMWIGKNMVHELQQDSAYTVLRNTVDLVGRTRITLEEQRNELFDQRKDHLLQTNKMAFYVLDSHLEEAYIEHMSPEEAESRAYEHLRRVLEMTGERVYVVDHMGRFIVHPDMDMLGRPASEFVDAADSPILDRIVVKARAGENNDELLTFYPWNDGTGVKFRLAAAAYYPRLNAVLCSDVPVGDYEAELEDKRQGALNELRARIREIVIGKSGYVYVFNEDCRMLSHPTLEGEDFGNVLVPDTGEYMCGMLKEAAERPWGENKSYYFWDLPQERGKFVHRKVSWITREPTTGWYVGVSAYVDEFESTLPRFIKGIFLPSLGSILLLGGALALLLHNLLRPVYDLTRMTQSVSEGDLSARAPEDISGEIGLLCRHFNVMVKRLQILRQKDEQRHEDLEVLNRNLENLVEARTRDLEEKAEKLQEANIRLRELDKLKSSFLSSVSHELRTPLTSVRGFAKLIARDFEKYFAPRKDHDPALSRKAERLMDNVEIIAKEGERLTRLINDVLDLSKIETGAISWHDSAFSISDVIDSSVRGLSSMAMEKEDVEIKIDIQPDMPMVLADRDRITQVVINLLDNALKFTSAGAIRIKACSREEWIKVEINDPGKGVNRENLVRIFDKFYQTESANETVEDKPKGTGLGLAICKNIISHYGGNIWAESEAGRGTSVFFELPTTPEPLPEVEATELPAAATEPEAARQASRTAPTVLVVDDESSIRDYLRQVLEMNGFDVVTAHDGGSALEAAVKHRPDLITMDMLMPGMNGRETIARLRENPETAGIPVMVVSVMEGGEEVAGDAFVTKPIDETRLLALATELTRPRPSLAKPCILLDDSGSLAGDAAASPLCSKDIRRMDYQELLAELDKGFEGTVMLKAPLAPRIDLKKLSEYSRIQIVIMPADPRPETGGTAPPKDTEGPA